MLSVECWVIYRLNITEGRKPNSTLNNQHSKLKQKRMDKNIYAAIAMALYEYQGNNVHDKEPGIITIKPRQTMWNAKFLSLTAKP